MPALVHGSAPGQRCTYKKQGLRVFKVPLAFTWKAPKPLTLLLHVPVFTVKRGDVFVCRSVSFLNFIGQDSFVL